MLRVKKDFQNYVDVLLHQQSPENYQCALEGNYYKACLGIHSCVYEQYLEALKVASLKQLSMELNRCSLDACVSFTTPAGLLV
jgi:hypothetical protein